MQGVPDWVIQQLQAGQYGQASPVPLLGGVQVDPNTGIGVLPGSVAGAPQGAPMVPQASPDPNMSLAPQQAPAGFSPAQPPPAPLNYTPAPPQAEQTPNSPWFNTEAQLPPDPRAAPQQSAAPIDSSGSAMAALLQQAAAGTRRVVPAGVRKAAEQWEQRGPAPMPGDTPAQTAKNRHDWENAVRDTQEAQDDSLLDRRMQLMDASERADDAARREILRGRGLADRLLQNQDEQARRKDAIDARVGELDRLIATQAETKSANPVQTYWTDMSPFVRIATATALGLGAMGQVLGGGENAALALTMKEIDGEINRQRNTVDTLGVTIAAKRALLGDMLQKFRSPEAAEMATRSILAGQAESEFRRQAAQETSAEAKANMTNLANEVMMQRAQMKQAATEGERRALYQYNPPRAVGRTGLDELVHRLDQMQVPKTKQFPIIQAFLERGPEAGAQSLHDAAKTSGNPNTREEIAAANFDLERRIIVPGRFGGGTAWGMSPARATKAQEGLDSADELLANNERLRKIVLRGTRLSPDDRAAVDQIAATNAGQWRVALGLGVMSESDKDLISPLTGAAINDMSLRDREKLLATAESLVQQSAKKYLRATKTGPGQTAELTQPQIRTRAVK